MLGYLHGGGDYSVHTTTTDGREVRRVLGAERGHGGREERSLGDQERTTLLAGLGWAGLGALPERGGGRWCGVVRSGGPQR